ncbi:hypothetical protein PG994_001743 [Apiospora phragmitis]|uniref:Uncharacterized protein n=1 Tax=Apiospora phragmitis TaxID=2905665 RepID=A0ABR1WUA3_9PEZI
MASRAGASPRQPNDRNNPFATLGKRPTWRDSFRVIGRGRRTPSFQSQAVQAEREAQQPKRYPQIVSVYNSLTWETLRDDFLLKKWPDEDYSQEPSRKKDHWQFETPEDLTDDDWRAIKELTKTKNIPRSPSPD